MDQYKFFGVPRRLKVLPAPGACPGCGSTHTTNWPRGSMRRPHTVGLCLDCKREWELEARGAAVPSAGLSTPGR